MFLTKLYYIMIMPYTIRFNDDKTYTVLDASGVVKARHTNLLNAHSQVRLLEYLDQHKKKK